VAISLKSQCRDADTCGTEAAMQPDHDLMETTSMTIGSLASTAFKAFMLDLDRLGNAKLHDGELEVLTSAAETRLLGGDITGETVAALDVISALEDAGRIEGDTGARLANGLLAIPLAVSARTPLAA
jgi:hypothetical protein